MKKTLLMVLLALSGLTACGDQKITQNVTIDKTLLDALQGKANGTATPNTPASVNPAPPSGSSSTGTSTQVSVSTDSKVLLKVIQDNADALNTQNIGAYTETLHPQSPFFKEMPNLFVALVQGQLQYRINSSQVLTHTDSEATVQVDRSTSSSAGTSHDQVLYTLRQSGTSWKVFFMQLTATAPSFDDSGSDDDFCFDQFGC